MSASDDLAQMPASAIAAVELNDGSAEAVGTMLEDTLHRRRLCGDGAFDTTGFIRAIRATGWDGPWGVEILSDQHRARDVTESIAAVYETTMGAFARA